MLKSEQEVRDVISSEKMNPFIKNMVLIKTDDDKGEKACTFCSVLLVTLLCNQWWGQTGLGLRTETWICSVISLF
jgi:hypothetical protein